MKKLSIFLFLIILIAICGNFCLGILAQKEYEEMIDELKSQFIITDINYNKTFFGANANFKAKIKDINFEVESKIYHDFIGVKSINFVKIKNSEDIFDLTGGKIILSENLLNNNFVEFHFDDIENSKIKLKDAKIYINSKKDKLLDLSVKMKEFMISLDSSFINLQNFDYKVAYKKPLNFKKFTEELTKINDVKSNLSIKNIIMHLNEEDEEFEFLMNNFKAQSDVTTKDENLTFNDKYFAKNMTILDDNFSNIKLNTKISNVDKNALENIINYNEEKLMQQFEKIIKNGIEINVNDLEFFNEKGKKFNLNLTLKIPKIKNSQSLFKLMEILSKELEFHGEIKTNFDDLDKKFERIFVENGENKISNFKYKPKTATIMFNDKISLSEVLDDSPTNDFEIIKQNLEKLISDLFAFYKANGEFAQNISEMTDILVVDITPTKATLFIGDLDCINLEIFEKNDKGFLKITKGTDAKEKKCLRIYKDSFIKDLLENANIELK